MEKVVDKATANNCFSVLGIEYVSNDITSRSFLVVVLKDLSDKKEKKKEMTIGKDGDKKQMEEN